MVTNLFKYVYKTHLGNYFFINFTESIRISYFFSKYLITSFGICKEIFNIALIFQQAFCNSILYD